MVSSPPRIVSALSARGLRDQLAEDYGWSPSDLVMNTVPP